MIIEAKSLWDQNVGHTSGNAKVMKNPWDGHLGKKAQVASAIHFSKGKGFST
jgi:hypothetical protein